MTSVGGSPQRPEVRIGEHSWLARLAERMRRFANRLAEGAWSLLEGLRRGLRALTARAESVIDSLPGPLRALARVLLTAATAERGFVFWWLVVMLGLAALVAVLLLPVTALVALLVVGIWMLLRRNRDESAAHEEDARQPGEARPSAV